jgi:hypothetical protein
VHHHRQEILVIRRLLLLALVLWFGNTLYKTTPCQNEK